MRHLVIAATLAACALPVSSASATDTSSPAAIRAKAVTVARGELGVRETPKGSNDGTRIATYRLAVKGAIAGAPWAGYFVSWVAREAGGPLGYGSAAGIAAWGRNNATVVPVGRAKPGMIAATPTAVGVIESVGDGKVRVIAGNVNDQVARTTVDADAVTVVDLRPPLELVW